MIAPKRVGCQTSCWSQRIHDDAMVEAHPMDQAEEWQRRRHPHCVEQTQDRKCRGDHAAAINGSAEQATVQYPEMTVEKNRNLREMV